MSEWLKYGVRLSAAGLLGMFAISMAIAAAAVEESRGVVVGMMAIFAASCWACWPRSPNAWRRDKPTKRQLDYAANLGIRVPRNATKGQVSDLISAVTGR